MTKYKCIIAGMAIVGITVMDCIALSHGINGTLMSLSVGSIGTIAGYSIKYKLESKE
jgi:hypothetical protein